MIVSNAANFKVGDGFRTPGEPVPEFATWQPFVQERELRLRRVIDAPDSVADEMRKRYAEKSAKADIERKERKLRAVQQEVKALSRQIATERGDTQNKVNILEETEKKLLGLASELGLSPDDVELAERPEPKGFVPAPHRPKPQPQSLMDQVAGMTVFDLCNFAAEELDIHDLDQHLSHDELVSCIFKLTYGPDVEIPKPTEDTGRMLGMNAAQLERYRIQTREELSELSVAKLKKQASELGVFADGNKAEMVEAIAVAIESRAAAEASRTDD